jgi:hypothetical protein
MFATILAATESRLLAIDMEEVKEFCDNWDTSYDCTCQIETFFNWEASGQCDFSEEGNPLGLANEYCAGAFDACVWDCESDEYRAWVINEECPVFDECDPNCYWDCWFTFAGGNSCNVGEQPDFSCTCDSFNWCEGC